MRRLRRFLSCLHAAEDGPTATEYAVLCALIVIAALAAIRALGGGVEGRWQQNAEQIINSVDNAGR